MLSVVVAAYGATAMWPGTSGWSATAPTIMAVPSRKAAEVSVRACRNGDMEYPLDDLSH